MIDANQENITDKAKTENIDAAEKQKKRRQIPGDLPYTSTPGATNKALEAIITAERPTSFSGDFVETVLKIPGGSGKSIPPLLKRLGFLDASGTPTDKYSRFKSDSARSQAALEGLKQGFTEIFRRNEYAHKLSDSALKDVIIEITGLTKDDSIVSSIVSTFKALSRFIKEEDLAKSDSKARIDSSEEKSSKSMPMNLQYHINIQLPDTGDIKVYNAIFKSLRENLF